MTKLKLPHNQQFCFCHDGVSLQMVSGGAAKEGYLGRVTLKIDGEYVEYIKAQPEQEQNLKLMPREATPEMLKAMDECSTEGYDERLYAGHAASVYMAAWDAFQSTEESQQEPSGNCPLEDCDGGPKSHGCWAHNCEWKPNKTQKQEPVALQMDVIVVNLVREGINKHRARELAEHFIKHITPPQPKQEPVAWIHTKIEGVAVPHRPADLDKYPDRWEALYKVPPPCPTCEALARTVMMDQTGRGA